MYTTATTTRPVVAHSATAVTGKGLVAAAHAGTVQFYKVRSNGSLRHWPVLAPGTKARKQAETWKASASKGVAAAAKQHKVSVATLRRGLTALAFTEELEAAKPAALAAAAKAVQPKPVAKVEAKPAAKAAPAKASKPKHDGLTAKGRAKLDAAIASDKPMSAKAKADAHAAKNDTVKQAVAAAKAKSSK